MAASLALAFLAGFSISAVVTPLAARRCLEIGLVDRDLHKPDRPEVAKLGGLGILAGFLSAITVSGFLRIDPTIGISILLSAVLGGLLGLIDDLFRLGKFTLIAGSALVGLPLCAFRTGEPVIYSTPWGPIDLGWKFWALVPLGFTFLMNAVNIYAGFNGIEAGTSLVTSASLAISAAIYGSRSTAVALAGLAGALVAFLYWNWYPARVFPGNVGTYTVGAILAASAVTGTIKMAALIATFPYTLNFLLRARRRFEWSVGTVLSDGRIGTDGIEALWSLWIGSGTTEVRIVVKAIAFQAAFGALAVLYSWLAVR